MRSWITCTVSIFDAREVVSGISCAIKNVEAELTVVR